MVRKTRRRTRRVLCGADAADLAGAGRTLSAMKLTPATAALTVGASARLWRLAAIDEAGWPARTAADWLDAHGGKGHVQEAISCPYCAGLWITAAVLATGIAWGETPAWVLMTGALALNYVAASLNAWLDVAPREDADELPT